MRIKRDYGIIYALTDPRDNKIRYIGFTGRTPGTRLGYHIRESRVQNNTYYKCKWIRKLEKLGLKPNIKVLLKAKYNELPQLEIDYIKFYKNFCRLTNTSEGGEGAKGNTWSIEARKRHSENLTGKKRPYTQKKVEIIDNITKEKYNFENVIQASVFVKCSIDAIRRVCKGQRIPIGGIKGKYLCKYVS